MNISNLRVLVSNGYIDIKSYSNFCAMEPNENVQLVGTILSNMAHYGYAPSAVAIRWLYGCAPHELTKFWSDYEPVFKNLTGADRNMEKFVVYKNFPAEVLSMDHAKYWINQIFMYIGVPNEFFVQEEEARPSMLEKLQLKVLAQSSHDTLLNIREMLIHNTSRWSDNQLSDITTIYDNNPFFVDVDHFSFKENGIKLAAYALSSGSVDFDMSNATDVLRLCAELSGGDISLRERVKFKTFNRPTRKRILQLLNSSKNLDEDFASRAAVWKQLLQRLHPGDYPMFSHVNKSYDRLYKGQLKSFNSIVDNPSTPAQEVLKSLASRPGEFVRRFHASYKKYKDAAVVEFCKIVPELTNLQLVKIHRYLNTISNRRLLMFAPKGNWGRAKIFNNTKKEIKNGDLHKISLAIQAQLSENLGKIFPNGIQLDENLKNVKLQTNDQKLAQYGRGTEFDIPDNIKFIRSASYWQKKGKNCDIWFDNGWNFFGKNWSPIGACAWTSINFYGMNGKDVAAVFSGDPTNSKDLKGRACQMIDLYLDKLKSRGVHYAMWNILCYSKVKFDEADEVLATLQMGENPESGKLYEPARAQMVFPLKGNSYTKYIAYIDVHRRKLVYIDVDFNGDVSSAAYNTCALSEKMSGYVEYLDSLPSVYDLLQFCPKGNIPFLYSDENISISEKTAYVFKPTNSDNSYEKINLSELL